MADFFPYSMHEAAFMEGITMLNILANSYLTASRADTYNHWQRHTRYDTRRSAEIEAQKTGWRRD